MFGKNIVITISGGFASRNILRSGVLDNLLNAGSKIILFSPQEKADYYQKEFGNKNVLIIGLPPLKEGFVEAMIKFLARNSVRTEISLSLQKEHLLSAVNPLNLISFLLKRLIGFLGFLPGFFEFVRFLDFYLVSEKTEILRILKEVNPDIVFATHVIDEFDASILREAKRLCIKTIGMVRSWDNLTGHGLVRELPDKLLLHSPWLFRIAKNLHRIPEKKLEIIGIPQYDTFFRKDFLISRDKFLSIIGLRPDNRIVLFAAISTDFAPYEWEIPEIIHNSIENGSLPQNVVVIARPHPNCGVPQNFRQQGQYLKIDTPAKYVGSSAYNWEQEKDDINHFANLLYHADVVVTGASTISMDAAIFDRPIINYAFDGYHKEVPYYQSVLRCYEKYTHYIAMVKTGGVRLVYSPEELIEWIKKYLNNPELDHEGRQRIIKEFAGFTDGRSAERISLAILGS